MLSTKSMFVENFFYYYLLTNLGQIKILFFWGKQTKSFDFYLSKIKQTFRNIFFKKKST